MNINRPIEEIVYNLQECVSCGCKNEHQCRVCSHKGSKLGYKYYENKNT